MNELYVIGLAAALGSCVSWFLTSRYYQRRLGRIKEERQRERQGFERELAVREERDRQEARERRRLQDLIRNITSAVSTGKHDKS
ncbi:MAG: hypothetical protein WKF73_18615 [Nocardioidaceae bacterium]|jgi:membrane protein implicated in regulation of membrane protease activity